jgi:hypothetical protein
MSTFPEVSVKKKRAAASTPEADHNTNQDEGATAT